MPAKRDLTTQESADSIDSAITLIDRGRLYYRGQDVEQLARQCSVEQVAALIWTGATADAARLFADERAVPVSKYETMLMHIGMDGAQLSLIQELQTCLPAIAADDPRAYDLRPEAVASSGVRILRLIASILAGEVPDHLSIATMLQIGWCPDNPQAVALLSAALIALADHELNTASFAARVVASAGSTPYAVVMAGLCALEGAKLGGNSRRVTALFAELDAAPSVRDLLVGRVQRGEAIPGFGHALYPQGDPRARLLLDLLAQSFSDHPRLQSTHQIIKQVQELTGEAPNVEAALVVLARVLDLPADSPLGLFALGRTIGWIGHAIEQYQQDRLIRPRARYTGNQP